MAIPQYVDGAELPSLTRDWYDTSGDLIDLSGYSFTVLIGIPGQAAAVEKTSGITGAATSRNLTINWSAGELDDLTAGLWLLQVFATLDAEQRVLTMWIQKRSAVAAA